MHQLLHILHTCIQHWQELPQITELLRINIAHVVSEAGSLLLLTTCVPRASLESLSQLLLIPSMLQQDAGNLHLRSQVLRSLQWSARSLLCRPTWHHHHAVRLQTRDPVPIDLPHAGQGIDITGVTCTAINGC